METVLAVCAGYLIGSVPFAYLLARRRGIDLRRVGSGNVGASNVLRTSGVPAAVVAMCLDAVKGAVAVVLAERFALESTPQVAAGRGGGHRARLSRLAAVPRRQGRRHSRRRIRGDCPVCARDRVRGVRR